MTIDPAALAAAQAARVPDPGDDAKPGSPLRLLFEMETEMVQRSRLIQLYEDYAEGRQKVSFVSAKYAEAFGKALAAVNDNWMSALIRIGTERLGVIGITLRDDRAGGEEAWRMWRANDLDGDSPLLFSEAAKFGEAYTLTWPQEHGGVFGRWFSRKSGTDAVITVEHPAQMIVRRAPGHRRVIEVALKRWIESDGRTLIAYLYTREATYRFRRDTDGRWQPYNSPGAPAESKNPYGEALVAPIVNNPSMLPSYPPTPLLLPPHSVPKAAIGLGRSDLADHIGTQDGINLLLGHFLVNSETRSFAQRWATGVAIPVDPRTKLPIEGYEAAVNRMWSSASDKAKFGSFPQDDPRPILDGIDKLILSMAARASIPAHYMPHPTGQYPSGESLKSAETAHVVMSRGKAGNYGRGLRVTMRHGFLVTGDRARAAVPCNIVWRDVETRSDSEFVDSLVKKLAMGVPHEKLWRDYGYSPDEITEMKGMLLDRDAVAQMLLAAGHPASQGEVELPAPAPAPSAGDAG